MVTLYHMFLRLFFLIHYFLKLVGWNWSEVKCSITWQKRNVCTVFLKTESIKINKERGPVYYDFDFDSKELLRKCISNITYRKR